jgi:hypothetical protein
VANDPIASGYIFKNLADVFTKRLPFATTVRASCLRRHMRLNITRQMLGQWATLRCTALDCLSEFNHRYSSGLGDVKLFEFKL